MTGVPVRGDAPPSYNTTLISARLSDDGGVIPHRDAYNEKQDAKPAPPHSGTAGGADARRGGGPAEVSFKSTC